MNGLVQPAIAFIATIILILLLRPLAVKLGFTDAPTERKLHQGDVPLVGGIAIFLALGIAIFSVGVLFNVTLLAFFSAAFLLVFVGVWDDWRGLSPLIRFAAQMCAGLIMVYGAGIVLTDLGSLTPSGKIVYLGAMAVPFTVFVTVGMINAINMCDGLDGLSGNMTLVLLAGLGFANSLWGNAIHLQLLNIVSAAIAGFLIFNQRMFWRNKAWVFLGDAGSMMLGFALAWNVIEITLGFPQIISPAAALWFLALPIYDTVTLMVRRIAHGRSPFQADSEHLHHLLVRTGFTVGETIGIICLLAALGCGVGMLVTYLGVADFIVALIFVAVGFIYMWRIQSAWRTGKFFGRTVRESVSVV